VETNGLPRTVNKKQRSNFWT